ncbi:MAG TPA: Hpt domain-containing protein [Rubrivivax sp.]|nr:Hpt domain-containing protein [Rubrivivax sp.]
MDDVSGTDDLSALAWVHGELRRSLEAANKALRRYLREAEAVSGSDVDAVDPSVLRNARSQIHQGVGALELVGMPAVADVLRASEAAVQRMVARPAMVDAAAVDCVERVSFALLDFLARQLAGKPVSPVMLFPPYRAALTLAGADRVHPADLWKIDWHWRELPPDPSATAREADEEARSDMEALVLSLMRDPGRDSGRGPGGDAGRKSGGESAPTTVVGEPARQALARMSDLCADLGAGARLASHESTHAAVLWQLAAAVFEAQAAGLLPSDVYSKRLASRLMAQLRLKVKGQETVSDRLAQDLLFFCSHAQAPNEAHPAPRLAVVRDAWNLAQLPTADYHSTRLGRHDPAVTALARKRVAAARDSWSAVAGGESHRMSALAEQFALVGESLQRLFPGGSVLAQALQTAVAQTVAGGQPPAPALAMEVATAILYLDASLEDGEFDHPELGGRIERLARRIDDVRIGAEPHALEGWMEELYRRVSDRQTMGSVVSELRATLSEVEKQIDQYFRDPSQREVLIPVPAQLSAMRGVLSVLGLSQASAAALHMRNEVDALAQTDVDPQQAIRTGTFDHLADNLGALSFLIDMLAVQPQLAKSLFRFDPETGTLSAVMGQREKVSAFSALDETGPPQSAAQSGPMEPGDGSLLLQLQSLAVAAADTTVGDAQIAEQLEPLAAQAVAADLGDLASLLAKAQRTLSSAESGLEVRRHVRAALADAVAAMAPPPAPELPASAPIPPAAPPGAPVAAGGSGLEDDAEMREIFIEEAREVIADAQAALERLADDADNASDMTAVRRAFHTLKGSSRMVGLRDFGEAGWACEQLYNARLAHSPRMDHPLRQLSSEALAYMADWTEAIAAGEQRGHSSAEVARAADALREHDQRLPIALPQAAAAEGGPALPAATSQTLPALVAPGFELSMEEEEPPAGAPDSGKAGQQAQPQPQGPPAAVPSDEPDLIFEFDPTLDTPSEFESTKPLPHLEPVAPLAPIAFEFDLSDDGLATSESAAEPAPAAAPIDTLMARVPDLPSAADLELGAVAPEAPTFELDLGAPADHDSAELNEPVGWPELALAAPAESSPPLDLPLDVDGGSPPAITTPLPDVVEAVVIDAAEFDAAFASEEEAVASPGRAATEPWASARAPAGSEFGSESSSAEKSVESAEADDDEQVKVIGPLRIGIPLFNIFLNEADELSRRLGTELAEWALEHERHPVPDSSTALAHSLAGNSATVGYSDLSALARALEHALMRSRSQGHGRPGEPELFSDAAEEIRRLLHQFAAGFLRPVAAQLMERLADHERWPPVVAEAPALPEEQETAVPVAPEVEAEAADQIDAVDEIDDELFPIFGEEADELLPQLQARLRDWLAEPAEGAAPAACMRALHTIKGGARLAGAMRLGEMAHRLETNIEALLARGTPQAEDVEPLLASADVMSATFDALRHAHASGAAAGVHGGAMAQAAVAARPAVPSTVGGPAAQVPAQDPAQEPLQEPAQEGTQAAVEARSQDPAQDLAVAEHLAVRGETAPPEDVGLRSAALVEAVTDDRAEDDRAEDNPLPDSADYTVAEPMAQTVRLGPADLPTPPQPEAPTRVVDTFAAAPALAPAAIDWHRFAVADADAPASPVIDRTAAGNAVVRVRAGLLDRMVNQAGEVSITRARIDSDVKQLQGSLGELTESLERLRRQLRDIELQAETQITSRMEAAKMAAASFDPLEMDRFTRFQELTRFMAESVNDVATLQRSLQRTLQNTEDELASQARLMRELQDDLLRTRMVEFESMADRLYRTARQAARDTGKPVKLEVLGGAIEIDRGVLERMVGPFEHLLRNSVAHGIEAPEVRAAAGKEAAGQLTITVAQSGNEVAVDFADDGAGLDLRRIRQRAVERGLLAADAELSDDELGQMIFRPGFSTAEAVTELAGRGIGLDVVRAEVNAMGGRIETHSQPGRGTRFRLLLPLTTAVTQVVMLRCGEMQIAVPSTLIEVVRRVPSAEVEAAYAQGHLPYAGEDVPFYWLASLLNAGGTRGEVGGRTQTVVVVRSAAQRVALHLDEVVGNQEVVVKNVGPQLSRLPGLAGVTLLPSGAVALIYNPVALASLYGPAAREPVRASGEQGSQPLVDKAATPEQGSRAALVLVVDDSLTVRRVTQRLLIREGYRVVTAKDGLDALARLAEERPAVLLSDIEMPRMDGFDLLRNVRADPALADLPVVMITSRIAQKHRDYATELGADHYLGKPYSEEELLGLVARYAGADVFI